MPERNKLPRTLSLKSRADIARLIKTGRRLTGDSFICVWEKSDSFKYGLFVSKAHGTAVQRNRLKRLMREAVRNHRHTIRATLNVGLFPKRSVGELSGEEASADIERIFSRLDRETKEN